MMQNPMPDTNSMNEDDCRIHSIIYLPYVRETLPDRSTKSQALGHGKTKSLTNPK